MVLLLFIKAPWLRLPNNPQHQKSPGVHVHAIQTCMWHCWCWCLHFQLSSTHQQHSARHCWRCNNPPFLATLQYSNASAACCLGQHFFSFISWFDDAHDDIKNRYLAAMMRHVDDRWVPCTITSITNPIFYSCANGDMNVDRVIGEQQWRERQHNGRQHERQRGQMPARTPVRWMPAQTPACDSHQHERQYDGRLHERQHQCTGCQHDRHQHKRQHDRWQPEWQHEQQHCRWQRDGHQHEWQHDRWQRKQRHYGRQLDC